MTTPRSRGLLVPTVVVMVVIFSYWLAELRREAETSQRAMPDQVHGPTADSDSRSRGPGPTRQYFFCFWNVENLFDDRHDHRDQLADREFDAWMADHADIRERKYENLAEVLASLNEGRGPDILALAEVEGARAAELLAERIHRRLGPKAPRYRTVVAEDIPGALRHITPALLCRLDVIPQRTRVLGSRQRILECTMTVAGQPLILVVSHWTARSSDAEGGARGRYADVIYREFQSQHRRDPAVDFLVCGDFNDSPHDPSVRDHLHAIGETPEEREQVLAEGPTPYLLNLFANRGRDVGTHYFRGEWFQFDQAAVSAGLLDNLGWSCDPDEATIISTSPPAVNRPPHRPHRFGGPTDRMPLRNRGYSDHLPIAVPLRVAVPAKK